MSDITIRTSRPADASELHRLAALDSQRLPAGDLLVAEVSGEIVAAYAPTQARAIADPFQRTADVVSLLELRAKGADRTAQQTRRSLFPIARAA
jgi:hypothetical protein